MVVVDSIKEIGSFELTYCAGFPPFITHWSFPKVGVLLQWNNLIILNHQIIAIIQSRCP